jgi:hypothetical protein
MRFSRIKAWRQVVLGVGGALVIASVPLFAFVWFIFGHEIENFLYQRKFDQLAWKSQDSTSDESWPPRLCMVDDLLARGRLDGLAESQVLELLGPPDSKNIGLYYYLGPERGWIRIDSEGLVVEFGKDGKVSRSRIYRD